MSSTAVLDRVDAQTPATVQAKTLVCLPPLHGEALAAALDSVATAFRDMSVAVALAEGQDGAMPPGVEAVRMASNVPSQATWVPAAAEYQNAWMAAREHGVRAVLLLGPDAASVPAATMRALAETVLGGHDLAVPHYPVGAHGALVNSAVLYPMTRALFGQTVRFPLPIDAALSPRMADRMAASAQRSTAAGHGDALLWPVAEAAAAGYLVREVQSGARTLPQPSAESLNEVLAVVVGSMFTDIEARAALWQRARLQVRAAPLPLEDASRTESAVELVPMIEAFRNAYTNLRELWSLVLPPNSLLNLKRLSQAPVELFTMPDELWARTVYDFVLAFRLRTINRGHLLGALTPLYLAWVASHLRYVGDDLQRAETHVEAVAAAFEREKPYLVARWRWPDRFNP